MGVSARMKLYPLTNAHALTPEDVFASLESQFAGLTRLEAVARQAECGPNRLPTVQPPGPFQVFARQFLNPLIYILLIVGTLSLLMGEYSDAGFIYGILVLNAIIGTAQEYNAETSAHALRHITLTRAVVRRDGEDYEVDAAELVPGDIVLLEPGNKAPADIRLLSSYGLEVDESLLTGESLPVQKNAALLFPPDTVVADRKNMLYAGTLITRGRATGVVSATSLGTELGRIADSVIGKTAPKTPLIVRMERFTKIIAIFIGTVAVGIAAVLFMQGNTFSYVLMLAVGLGVSAIPEGLPVAITIALAIASRRMAGRNVVVRRLEAVEALGSCTFICADKTGTLTVNELTVRRLAFPGMAPWEITGAGTLPEGEIIIPTEVITQDWGTLIEPLCRTAVFCNEAFLGKRDEQWVTHGDKVDIALLVMAHKAGITRASLQTGVSKVGDIPFEPEQQYAASCHAVEGRQIISVKGAPERLLVMCTTMLTIDSLRPLDANAVEEQAYALAHDGYRVLAFATRVDICDAGTPFGRERLGDLTFLGFVGMIDPLRPEAKSAVQASMNAGMGVAMITGDHPITALAIARELGLAKDLADVMTGAMLKKAPNENTFDRLVANTKVFARVEPQQKLLIVQSKIRQNHFVAVTGDGVNDAPALKAAHVGVAMGKNGTDVARENADLIITDDRFSSIVAGIEEGRVAYANIRKVVYLLISTGAAEIVLFILSVLAGLPMPLTAVQLLWLNLVTNGIQDVALAFEAAEGDEMKRPPRPPNEPIFNRIMVERVALSAVVMGGIAFAFYINMMETGIPHPYAQNKTLLLMVLFENIMIGNCRSEIRSAFSISPLKNPLLITGTIIAQLIHLAAMHSVWFGPMLAVQPVSLGEWAISLMLASCALVTMEIHKYFKRRMAKKT